ncbi:MAG: hypothetical protein AB8B78_14385 [Polaribacter sp.]
MMNYRKIILVFFLIVNFTAFAQHKNLNLPLDNTLIFEEKNGFVAIESEFFMHQTATEIRQWFRTSKKESPKVGKDEDAEHVYDASNNAYLEILPDERVTHNDKLVKGENFSNKPGKLGVLNYKVKFNSAGRYYVWVRAFSTGSEDNGLHVGLNNIWPESGKRIQWCKGKNEWTWSNNQRTKEIHCGVPHQIYLDIKKPGTHTIQFSMREDGFEFDKFILTKEIDYIPIGNNQKVVLAKGTLPKSFPKKKKYSYFKAIANAKKENKFIAAQEFPIENSNFYKNGKNWLAINPEKFKEATTSTSFTFESGNYDIIFVGVGENDGQSTFTLSVNDKKIGSYNPKITKRLFVEGKTYNKTWENITLKKGDKITVTAKVATDGNEWTRGRWAGVIFTPVGKAKDAQNARESYTSGI